MLRNVLYGLLLGVFATVDLVGFTEEILNGKFHFFCAVVDNNLSNKLFRSFYVIQL